MNDAENTKKHCFIKDAQKIIYPNAKGKKSATFYDYTVYSDGTFVSNKTGKILSKLTITGPESHVNIFINKERVKINIARAVYIIFNGEKIDRNIIIEFIDNDSLNKNFENLKKVSRKDHWKNINLPKKKKKIDEKTVLIIQQEYKEGTQGGRLRNSKRKEKIFKIPSYRTLAEKYNCSLYTIQKVINQKY